MNSKRTCQMRARAYAENMSRLNIACHFPQVYPSHHVPEVVFHVRVKG